MNQKYINSQSAPSTPICFVPELSGNKTNKPATSKLYQHPSAEDLKFKKIVNGRMFYASLYLVH